MGIKTTPTEELDSKLLELLKAENPDADLIRAIGAELKLRTPAPSPEQLEAAQAHYERIYHPEIPAELTPSPAGRECLGNGTWPGYECQCPDCDYYATVCFSDFESLADGRN